MSDLQSNIIAVLRTELVEEAASAFPRLKRVPCTDIIWFLDWFAALDSAEQESLLNGLARWGALGLFPKAGGPQVVEELERQHPAFARFRAPRSRMGYKGGTRYTAVKMLSMDPGMKEIGYYHEDYRKNCSPLAFQPRVDLLPDLSYLRPAKAPLLRKLVNAAMAKLFGPEKQNRPAGEIHYIGSLGASMLKVSVDFGSMLGQLRYGVSVTNPDYTIKFVSLSYEQLWDANLGWDYLTEENAARSIDFLAEQVTYLVKLVDRVNGRTNGCS
jgi:hypothetical protein